jgi:hypothetical protein
MNSLTVVVNIFPFAYTEKTIQNCKLSSNVKCQNYCICMMLSNVNGALVMCYLVSIF